MPLDARKIRGDPKSRAQRPLLTCVLDALEVRQERVDSDASQFLRRVGRVRRFKRTVGKSGEISITMACANHVPNSVACAPFLFRVSSIRRG